MSGRVYIRKFDWAEARRLRKQGLTYTEIGARLGVSAQAVRFACDGRARSLAANLTAEAQRSGICMDCGARISKNYSRPVSRCRECENERKATNVRDTELRCITCKQWKSDNDFPWSRSAKKTHRGRHEQCRACQTIARQDYRERHKVPCIGCGKPALPPNEKRTRGFSAPRCRACYEAQRQKAA